MSTLTFQARASVVVLRSRKNEILGVWKAHNNVETLDRQGNHHNQWPVGTWPYDYSKAHDEEQMYPSGYHSKYGGLGIHIFKVFIGKVSQTGMGIHAGRTLGEPMRLGGKTHGCIRVTREAMEAINKIHQFDRLESITVER